MKTFRRTYLFIIGITVLTFGFTQRGSTQAYVVDSIAYQPYSFTAGSPMLIRLDDTYSQPLPIGFDFSFFGSTYSQLIAGSNGNLTFDLGNAGLYDPWPLDGIAIPGSNVPFKSIFGAYRDIDNTYIGNITYQLLGTAPNRVFIISYDSIPLYGSIHSVSTGSCTDSSLSTFQVALYEGCNSIEVYIHHSPSCAGWNSGRGIVGILDSTGTVGLAAPGRNDTTWTADDEAWRFSLSGGSVCTRSSAGLDQTLCINHVATMQATGTGVWSEPGFNPTPLVINNPLDPTTTVTGFSMTGSYVLTWTSTIDTTTITVNVVSCSDSVWPGDADFNGLVDNDDLLPIGLGYDSTGPARAVQGIVWQADAATPWTDSLANYVPALNFKHADCNGDGVIDVNDENAIYQNFSLLHAKTSGPGRFRSNLPTLRAVASVDSLHAGDPLTINFVLADSSISVPNFYGIAFTYNYDPSLVDSAFTGMTYSNSWIGSTDKITFVKVLHSTGEIKTAVTRTDHTSRSGYGAIGSASFKVRTDLSAQALSYLVNSGYISDIHAVDPTGRLVALNASTDTTFIAVSPLAISELSTAAISLRPNPAHDKVMILADQVISEISISNTMGQEMLNSKFIGSRSANIDISAYSGGLYFVQVKTEKGLGTTKLVVEK